MCRASTWARRLERSCKISSSCFVLSSSWGTSSRGSSSNVGNTDEKNGDYEDNRNKRATTATGARPLACGRTRAQERSHTREHAPFAIIPPAGAA